MTKIKTLLFLLEPLLLITTMAIAPLYATAWTILNYATGFYAISALFLLLCGSKRMESLAIKHGMRPKLNELVTYKYPKLSVLFTVVQSVVAASIGHYSLAVLLIADRIAGIELIKSMIRVNNATGNVSSKKVDDLVNSMNDFLKKGGDKDE